MAAAGDHCFEDISSGPSLPPVFFVKIRALLLFMQHSFFFTQHLHPLRSWWKSLLKETFISPFLWPCCFREHKGFSVFTCKDFCSLKDAASGCAGHWYLIGHIIFSRRHTVVGNYNFIFYHKRFTVVLVLAVFLDIGDIIVHGLLNKREKENWLF